MEFSAKQIEGIRALVAGIEQRALSQRGECSKPYYPRPSWHCPERILSNVFSRITRGSPEECHIWTGANVKGYGVVTVARRHMLITRLLWAISFGPIPEGSDVLHRCDNPPCCNLAHLFLGTAKDNAQDMVSKGRARNGRRALGSENNKAVLTEGEVREIRKLRANGRSNYSLGRQFSISRQNVRFIVNRKTWKHI